MLAWVVINQGTLVESGWDSRLGMVNTGDCRRTGIDMVLRMGEVLYMGGREGKNQGASKQTARGHHVRRPPGGKKKTTRNRKEPKHTAPGFPHLQ